MKVRVTTVGNSTGIVLPKEALAKLRVQKGDVLYMTETTNGFQLMPYDPEFERQMNVAREVMRENRDVLRKLAK